MRPRRASAAFVCAALLTTATLASAKETTLDDFESAGAPAPWAFSNGAEFPGAKGSLSKGAGHTGSGAELAYDFTGGGAYVAATLTLATPIDAAAIGFWTKAPAGIHAKLRVVDSTSQVLQYDLTRPLDATDGSAWFRQVVELDAPSGHFGGANDGVVHAPIGAVSILAADPLEPKETGAIDFDEVVAVDALGATIDLSAPITPAPAGASDLAPRLAVNVHFFADDAALDAAKNVGFSRVRMDFFWNAVESTKGVYDFTQLDALVASLAKRGMTLHLILDYGNPLYPPTGDAAFVSTTVPAFAAVTKATADHLKGKGVTFEIWNEANLKQFWPPAPDATQYAALCKAGIAAVHEGDPTAKVSTTGTSSFDFAFDRAMIGGGGAAGADAIGVHPYRATSPETFTDELLLLRAIAADQPGKPAVWDTEWGYSSSWFGDGHAADSRAQQARMVVREILSAWAVGLPLAVDYDLRDDGADPTNAEHNFGVLQTDLTDKPAAVALRTLSNAAKGRTFVGTLDLAPTTLHAMRLEGATDATIVVWAERGSVPVTVPTSARGLDMSGATIDLSSGSFLAKVEDGPRYLTIASPPKPDAGPDASSDAKADTSTDAPSSTDATPDAAPPATTNDSSGCGCSIAGDERSPGFYGLFAIAAATLRRRRRSLQRSPSRT